MLYRDSLPTPDAIPADAIAVLVFERDEYPQRWRLAAILTDCPSLDDAFDAAGREMPELDGMDVVVTKMGGRAGVAQRLTRSVTEKVAIERCDPPPPPELAVEPGVA